MMTLQQIKFRVPGLIGLGRMLFFPALFIAAMLTAGTSPFTYVAKEATSIVADTTNIEAAICTGLPYEFGSQQLTESGTYVETFLATDGSDSTVVLVLTVLPAPVTEIAVTLCEGEPYLFDDKTLTESGFYTTTLTTAEGCDSIVNLTLEFVAAFEVEKVAEICPGDTVFFAGLPRTESGIYVDSLLATGGCDSIVTLRLTVLPVSETNFNVGICAGTTYVFQNDTFDQSGLYAYTYPAANGCDSTVSLKLLVADYFEIEIFATICSDASYTFGGADLTESGVYYDSLQAVGGCDSTLILNLIVLPPNPITEVDAIICNNETYQFGNDLLSDAGEYTLTLSDQNGCDSTILLSLTVLPASTTEIVATICMGETFEAGGEILTESGDYLFVLQAENGCDSTLIVTLTVLPTAETAINATLCNGDTYNFEGADLNETGTYTATYTAENGCDSIVVLHLEVLPEVITDLEVTICAGDSYAFNGDVLTDAGFYSAVLTSETGCDSTVNLTLTVAPLEETYLEATVCAGESVEFNGDILTQTGEYVIVLATEFGCDSTVTFNLTVLDPIPETEELAKICAGTVYFFNGQALTEEGTYEVTLTSENGCDSVVVLNLGVIPVVTTELEVTICSGERVAFNGETLTESGTYTEILPGSNGCDSITVLTLTVNPVYETTLEIAICAGESYEFNGNFFDTEGAYTAIYDAENGCDSTVILQLSILPLQETTISAVICANETYAFDGSALNASGTYTAVFSGENGCDSTVTLLLDVLETPITILTATICSDETYEFGGDQLFTSGTYAQILTAENGCDSFVVLNLQVFPVGETNLSIQICAGTEYVFDGQTLTESGFYSVLLTTINGCDSLVTLDLSVADTIVTQLAVNICAGETYLFNGQDLTASGTYDALYVAEGGCDSLVVLDLSVLPIVSTDLEAAICAGATYEFNGAILTDNGVYTALLSAENGCDSTVTLALTVLPAFVTEVAATICTGEIFEFNGDDLTESGTYTALLSAENGCDSTVTLALTVLPAFTTDVAATICTGETFEFNGDDLTESGTYTTLLSTENGCDSTVTLALTVLPASATDVAATICAGETFGFNGDDLTESGTYTALFSAENGCDSTVTLALTVLTDILTTVSAKICAGETYPFAGQVLTQSGVYSAIFNGSNGCDSTVTLTLTVITVNAGVTLQTNTLTAQATNSAYQWIDCANNQPISGAMGVSFTPAFTGDYAVLVTQDGCTVQSVCTTIVIVGTGETLTGMAWHLQPNPARGQTFVQLENILETRLEVEVYDLTGKNMLRKTLPIGTPQIALDLNSLSNGMYFVRLSDGQSYTETKRLIVVKD